MATHSEIELLKQENQKLLLKLAEHEKQHASINKEQKDYSTLPSAQQARDIADVMQALSAKAFSVIVYGSSGDLAKKKTYPALYALYRGGLIPANTIVVGFARSASSHEDFRVKLSKQILKGGTPEQLNHFVSRCYYLEGNYDEVQSYQKLNALLLELEAGPANRVFYFAIPPFIYANVANSMSPAALSTTGFNRIIAEKPFGKDLDSFHELNRVMSAHFAEDQIYRIDHYLGKEMVQNLLTLRFANGIFEPLWNRHFISSVIITFKENIGLEGRGGYFDQYGIIRDVMQNHLTQVLSLVAMEAPVSLASEDIRDEKVKVLKAISPLTLDNLIVAQFEASEDGKNPGYFADPTVPGDSIAPTYACAVVFIDNVRWHGVPFILKCGKGLNERKAEIRIAFKNAPGKLYKDTAPNELVLRVQPDEAIYMKVMTKRPGLQSDLLQSELDLTYKARGHAVTYDAYERLILDTIRGDPSLFVRSDELEWAWRIFTPALKELESKRIKPFTYPFGARSPVEADQLLERHGYLRADGYNWIAPKM